MENNIKYSKIINKTIKDAVEYENINSKPNSGIWFSLKKNILNAKNTLAYNIINRGKIFDYNSYNYVHLFHSSYYLKKEEDQIKFEKKFQKIIYFSYRKNYPIQINYKNNSVFTSDCGWGCMIRSSQMILGRAIYKILRKNNEIDRALKLTINLFLDYPDDVRTIGNIFSNYYKTITNQLNINHSLNKKIYMPFSIRNICNMGEIVDKTCGEWFSDANLPLIYNIINTNMNVIPNLKIINFTSHIILKNIIEKCFKKIDSIINTEDKKIDYIVFNNEQYTFENMGLLFISVRLGINNISENYIDSIKQLFSCKQFLGFIGGKNNEANYFIGYNEKNMLSLDPHFSQESIIPPINEDNINSYIQKTLFQIPFTKLKPAFTMAFLFTDIFQFNDLVNFFDEYSLLKFPCFSVEEGNNSFLKLSYSFMNNSKNDF